MPVTTLKLGRLQDTKPVKLTIAVDPSIKTDLELYAALYEEAYSEKAPVEALIPAMLERFLDTDAGFKKARKQRANS